MVNYIGVALLFAAILFSGKKIGDYLRLRKRLGKLILSLSPSRGQKKFLVIISIVFILLLCIVTLNYVSRGISLNVSYSLLLAAVIFSAGRFTDSITEFREGGMIGRLAHIEYSDIKSYKYTEDGKRQLVVFQIKPNLEFTAIVTKEDKDTLDETVKRLR